MNLKLKNTPEQVELIKSMGSKDLEVSRQATQAFAAFIGPVIQKVIAQAATAGMVYSDVNYDEDDSPSYPLDLYYNEDAGLVKTWSQGMAGGLPSSQVEGMKEMKIATYRLDSAVSFLKKYARRGRLDVVSKAVERMAQEVLVKQERNAWAVIMKALAEASTLNGKASSASGALNHGIQAVTDNIFTLDELNRLMTLHKRLNQSFAGGTPSESRGLTDIFVSPEIMEQIRAFVYQPMNTRGPIGVTPTAPADGIALSDSVRDGIWNAAGAQELYGMAISEVYELGVGQKYNTLFDTFAGTTTYPSSGGAAMAATDEVIVGIDASRDAFIRPVAQQSETGGTFTAQPDDQFLSRHEKTGFWGYLEEGRVCIDARAIVGVIV